MQSLFECDSLSWSAKILDTGVSTAQQHSSHSSFLQHTRTQLNLSCLFLCLTYTYRRSYTAGAGDNTAWQHCFPFPATGCFALSLLNTRPLPPFQKQLPLCFCLIGDNGNDVFQVLWEPESPEVKS